MSIMFVRVPSINIPANSEVKIIDQELAYIRLSEIGIVGSE